MITTPTPHYLENLRFALWKTKRNSVKWNTISTTCSSAWKKNTLGYMWRVASVLLDLDWIEPEHGPFGMASNVEITRSEVPLKAQSILALLENISHILRACICKLFNWVDLKAAKPTYILPKVAKPLLTLKLRNNSYWCYWDNNTSLLDDSIVTELIHNAMKLNVNYLFWKTLNPRSEQ